MKADGSYPVTVVRSYKPAKGSEAAISGKTRANDLDVGFTISFPVGTAAPFPGSFLAVNGLVLLYAGVAHAVGELAEDSRTLAGRVQASGDTTVRIPVAIVTRIADQLTRCAQAEAGSEEASARALEASPCCSWARRGRTANPSAPVDSRREPSVLHATFTAGPS